MQHQELVFRQAGQRLVFDPPHGRPDAARAPSAIVLDDGYPVAATTGACTVDPVATTLQGDAHTGSKRIRVSSTAGIVAGGRYLMTKPDGSREWLHVAAVGDHTLFLVHPLVHRYAGAATIAGCRLSIAVDDAWASDPRHLSDAPGARGGLARYVVRWTYATDDRDVSAMSFVDLVAARSMDLVTPSDMARRHPAWAAQRPERGADFIAEAVRAIRLEAIGDTHAQRKIRDVQVIRELVDTRANVIRLEHDVMFGEGDVEELAIAEKRYRACYGKLIGLPKLLAREPEPPAPPAEKQAKRSSDAPRKIPKLTRY